MCTNYTPVTPQHLGALPGLTLRHLPADTWPAETYPGFVAPIVHRGLQGDTVAAVARFGLMPRWARDAAHAGVVARGTLNARSESVAEKPSFRQPWRERRFALVPMLDFFEPCWEDAARHGNRSVRWRLHRPDHQPFAVAGLHEHWTDRASGEVVHSFTLLTVNADGHPLLGRMHRPGDEKRTPVLVPPERWQGWLDATPEQAATFMHRTPDELLVGEPAPRGAALAPVQAPLF